MGPLNPSCRTLQLWSSGRDVKVKASRLRVFGVYTTTAKANPRIPIRGKSKPTNHEDSSLVPQLELISIGPDPENCSPEQRSLSNGFRVQGKTTYRCYRNGGGRNLRNILRAYIRTSIVYGSLCFCCRSLLVLSTNQNVEGPFKKVLVFQFRTTALDVR